MVETIHTCYIFLMGGKTFVFLNFPDPYSECDIVATSQILTLMTPLVMLNCCLDSAHVIHRSIVQFVDSSKGQNQRNNFPASYIA